MFVVFLPIFEVDTKITFVYNFIAPLSFVDCFITQQTIIFNAKSKLTKRYNTKGTKDYTFSINIFFDHRFPSFVV